MGTEFEVYIAGVVVDYEDYEERRILLLQQELK
jgi:hypothetical protein